MRSIRSGTIGERRRADVRACGHVAHVAVVDMWEAEITLRITRCVT
jgi:hypothetical protein